MGHLLTTAAFTPEQKRKTVEDSHIYSERKQISDRVAGFSGDTTKADRPILVGSHQRVDATVSAFHKYKQFHGEHLEAIRTLQAGAEGEVTLVKHKGTQELYAVKTVLHPELVGGRTPFGKCFKLSVAD